MIKLGEEKKSSDKVNCMTCRNFSMCADPKKHFRYACVRWGAFDEMVFSEDAFLGLHESKPGKLIVPEKKLVKTKTIDVDQIADMEATKRGESKLIRMVNSALESEISLPPDFRIDDRDMPLAPNVWEWISGKEFLASSFKPYPRQFELAVRFMADWCPRCSKKGFWEKMHVDEDMGNVLDNIQLLRNGRCPKCKSTRSEMVRTRELLDAIALVAVVGQRCVVGSTLVATNYGLQRIGAMQPKAKHGFSTYSGPNVMLENGFPVKPTKFYKSRKETVYTVTLANGMTITGTAEHPLMTSDDFIKIGALKPGQPIPVFYGQNVWSKRNPKGNTLRSYPNPIAMAKLMGFWVAEGTGYPKRFQITNHDEDVLEFCADTLRKNLKQARVVTDKRSVMLRGARAISRMDTLLGGLEKTSARKSIPNSILSSSRETVCAFLQGMFEGDGTVEASEVVYTTISKHLASDLSVVLHYLGIPCRVRLSKSYHSRSGNARYGNKRTKRNVYNVVISSPQALSIFASAIGFFSDRKLASLEQLLQDKSVLTRDVAYLEDRLPERVSNEYKGLIHQLDTDLSKYPAVSTKHGSLTHCSGALSSLTFFPIDDQFKRIYDDTLNVSRNRVLRNRSFFTASPVWRMVSPELRAAFAAFYDKYIDTPNTYWTHVVSVTENKVKQTTYDFHIPVAHRFMAGGLLNHNSGKSFTTAVIETFMIHKWLRAITNPQALLSLPQQQLLTGTYISMTFEQTLRNLFTPIRNFVTDTPWFSEYHKLLTDYEENTGENLFTVNELFIRYRHRRLLFHVASANKRSLRGATRISSVNDELGWFQNSDKAKDLERASGSEVYDAMERSLGTATTAYHNLSLKGYNNMPKPYIAAISSPSDTNDKVMELYRDGVGTTTTYCVKAATWEFNPHMPKTAPLIVQAFRRDPVSAMRDWGAEPPLSAAGWVSEIGNVTPLFDPKRRNAVSLKQVRLRTRTGSMRMSANVVLHKEYDGGRVLTLDAARTNNAFGFAVAHKDDDTGKIVFDALGEVQPATNCPISFLSIYENVLLPLVEGLGVRVVVTDTWQNVKILDTLEQDTGVTPFQQKLKYSDFVAAKDSVYDRKVVFPALDMKGGADAVFDKSTKTHGGDGEADTYPSKFMGKPVSHLLYQIMSVRDYPQSAQVTKGPGTNDDIFRCFVLAHWALSVETICGIIAGEAAEEEAAAESNVIGVIRGMGGSGGGRSAPSIGYSASMPSFGAGAAAPSKSALRSDMGRGANSDVVSSPMIGAVRSSKG